MMTRTTTALAAAAFMVTSACTGSQTPDAGSSSSTITLGTAEEQSACITDQDCPPGYRCQIPACILVDNDADNDGYDANVDCNDQDPGIHPGVAEACNNRDDNCNGAVDEGVRNACGACGPLPVEVCDLLDNDCDGLVDNGCIPGQVPEREPNDGDSNCQEIASPMQEGDTITLTGALSPAGDLDSFCFRVSAGFVFTFDVNSQSLGAPTDSIIVLRNRATGTQLPGGFNDFGGGPDPLLENYLFTQDVEVRVDLYNAESNRGGPAHTYQLLVTLVTIPQCADADGDGVTTCQADCRDDEVLVFPGQTEVCDGEDNNCDGVVDEGCADLRRPEVEPNNTVNSCEFLSVPFTVRGVIGARQDKDVYCFFAAAGQQIGFDVDAREPPGDSTLNSRIKVLRMPNTVLVQNDDGADPQTGYMATDSDSYVTFTFAQPGIYAVEVSDESTTVGGARLTYAFHGELLNSAACTDADGDGVTTCEGDCRDDDPQVHFGRVEVCDGKDNDCNNVVDNNRCSGDFDGDGVAGVMGDCNDEDPFINPAATETCDLVDNDCDGLVDEEVTNACGTCGNPPAEVCQDGVDNDCDGTTDTDCSEELDDDGVTPGQGDCDDTDDTVNPQATEICDGRDNDCDGLVDEFVKNACGECAPEREEVCDGQDNNCNGLVDDGALNACGECGPPPAEVCDEVDNDCDSQVDEGLTNACGTCGPLPAEICDGEDNNCDGTMDENCDVDVDMDGQTRRQGDCNDLNFSVRSGQPDICGDGLDNNCNGRVDEFPDCPISTEVEPNGNRTQCGQLRIPGAFVGVVTAAADLDVYCFTIPPEWVGVRIAFDIDAVVNGSPLDALLTLRDASGNILAQNNSGVEPPSMTPTVDPYIPYTFTQAGAYSLDVNAAAGTPTTAGATATYALLAEVVGGCLDLDGDGFPRCEGDCDDHNAAVNPGAVDVCDSVDNNCSGVADERCVNGCLDDVLEENDTVAQAVPIPEGARPDLTYCGGDTDFYVVELTEAASLRVDVLFAHATANLGLEILDDQLNSLGTSDDMDDNESLTLPLAAGDYYVRVFGRLQPSPYELVVTVTP